MPVCIRCRREVDDEDPDDLVLTLDGPGALVALRELAREDLDENQRELLERLAAGLCPVCGHEL